MNGTTAELVFDLLLVAAAGLAFAAYMFGVVLDPLPAVVAGLALLGVGLLAVPREGRAVAAAVGGLAVALAGAVVPRVVVRSRVADELGVALLAGGLVLLLAVALLHATTFDRPAAGVRE